RPLEVTVCRPFPVAASHTVTFAPFIGPFVLSPTVPDKLGSATAHGANTADRKRAFIMDALDQGAEKPRNILDQFCGLFYNRSHLGGSGPKVHPEHNA